MYNRYTPQPDGSYHRNRIPDQPPRTPNSEAGPVPPPSSPVHSQPPPKPPEQDAGRFLRNLIPKDFDTGDLLIVLLLLLMSGNDRTDSGEALLTLALYFIL